MRLDDDGNAFALLLGGGSCASGSSVIEASLEKAPYTTYTASFTIEPPVPGSGAERPAPRRPGALEGPSAPVTRL